MRLPLGNGACVPIRTQVKTLEFPSAEPLLVGDRADSRRIWQAIARGGLRGDPGGREAIGPR